MLLWNQLKNKQLHGLDFDRQKPLDNYVVDFYCKELMLAIEVDGDSHDYTYELDIIGQQTLEGLGMSFLRFDDREINKTKERLRTIEAWIRANQKCKAHP